MSTWKLIVYGFICLIVGALIGGSGSSPRSAADQSAAAACYEEFNDYVSRQNEWLRKHNAELQSIVELNQRNDARREIKP